MPKEVSDQFEVTLTWTGEDAGFIGRTYYLLHGSSRVRATITGIKYKIGKNDLKKLSADHLRLDDTGKLTVSLDEAIAIESDKNSGAMDAFVLIDRYTDAEVGTGTINFALRRASNIHRQALTIDRNAREELNGHRGKILWFTGLSGSGKSTVANALEQELYLKGVHTYILDGDNIRRGLNKDLGFTDADRVENIRRISEVARLMMDAGLVVLTSFISPFRSERDMARALFDEGEFIEIYVNVPLEVAEERDPKGLYKKARRGELPNFTGIDSRYEAPEHPEVELATAELSVEDCVARILKTI